ncbi:PAS domain S-box-containing protein [Bacillus ectoiniformans]|uniref:sigma-54 interaction domain-containing protein n=1 Tax=Bacillus ectoiniformans TaxID=1494429 RepID=UPI0019594A85|nr:sigma 54-interacting transcriptional regulator [Bacillus ectoiniformans]MBM7649670.1 PAS domain S-box-containing protein [Bacillus ectoiniformans]
MRLEKHLLSILESLHDAVIVILTDSTIVYVNQAYSTQFAVPAKKIIGRKLTDIEADARILSVIKDGKPLINDCSYVHSLKKDVCANITPLMENGEMIGAVTIMKDISEVTNLQEELTKYKEDLLQLREQLDRRNFSKLESRAEDMQKAVRLSKKIARTDATVMLYGESGVGKEVFAKGIHEASHRNSQPYIPINIASIPDSLFESEMFGYEEGSFTGSRKGGKKGLLEMANGGTLLLDEIGEMSLNMQSKLLRVIQERQFQKVGGTKFYPLDVRIICATHRNLSDMIRNGEFREDLYYRINVVPIHIPPLRQRKEDLEYITRNILNELCLKYGKHVRLEDEVMTRLSQYDWPGNVRELVNVLERMVAVCTNSFIRLSDLPDHFFLNIPHEESAPYQPRTMATTLEPNSIKLSELLEQTEKDHIEFILKNSKNKTEAIRTLGISRKSFYAKLKKYQIF